MTQEEIQQQIDEIKAEAQAQVKSMTEANQQIIEDQKSTIADLEAKLAEKQNVKSTMEVTTMAQSNLSEVLKAAFVKAAEGRQVDLKTVHSVHVTGSEPDGDASKTIVEELSERITLRMRENTKILSLIHNMTTNSVDYRQMVLTGFPDVADGVEQVDGVNWQFTKGQAYQDVAMKVGKLYAKPFISKEATRDPKFDLLAQLEMLAGAELSRKWAMRVLFGDGSAKSIDGILTKCINDTESKKKTWGASPRPVNYYPILETDTQGALGADDEGIVDYLIDLTTELPSQYLANAKFVMNRKTLGILRKLRNKQGEPVFSYNAGLIEVIGQGVELEDFMPDVGNGTTPIIFGDLKQAYALVNIDDDFLLDPYSMDGAIVLKITSRKGSLVLANDAIVVAKVQGEAA